MSKKSNNRNKEDDEFNSKHYFKFKQSTKNRKLYRNIDNVLKKKSLRELEELEYDRIL